MALAQYYDFDRVILTLNGVLIRGYGDSGITCEPMSPHAESAAGPDGSVVVNRRRDPRWKVTLALMETGTGNLAMDTLFIAQKARELIPGSPIVGIFSLVDLLSGESITAPAWLIVEEPSRSKGPDAAVREWVLEVYGPKPTPAVLRAGG